MVYVYSLFLVVVLGQVVAFLRGMGFCVRSLLGGGFLRPER